MLYLASGSQKRSELLREAGYKFRRIVTDIPEEWDRRLSPEKNVKLIALAKAEAAAKRVKRGVIISADTVVVFDDKVIGKPRSERQSLGWLLAMRGKTQSVITGVCVLEVPSGRRRLHCARTVILCRNVPRSAITEYVRSGRGKGRAGGYAVEGPRDRFVKILRGSLTNVMGLPMGLVNRILTEPFK